MPNLLKQFSANEKLGGSGANMEVYQLYSYLNTGSSNGNIIGVGFQHTKIMKMNMENVTAKMRTTIIQNKVGDFEILRNRKKPN